MASTARQCAADLRSGRRSGVIEVSQLDNGTVSATFVPNESFERTTDDADLLLSADTTAGIWQQSDQVVVEGETWGTIAARWTDDERMEVSFVEIDGQRLLPGGRHFAPTSADEAIAITTDESGWPSHCDPVGGDGAVVQSSSCLFDMWRFSCRTTTADLHVSWGEVNGRDPRAPRDRARRKSAFLPQVLAILSDLEVHTRGLDSARTPIEESPVAQPV